MRHIYTTEQKKFIENNCKGAPIRDLVKLFNTEFKTDLTYEQIRSFMKNRKLTSDIDRKELAKTYSEECRIFTDEQEKFIRDNAKGLGNKELTLKFNEHFDTNFEVSQIRCFKKNHNISSGLTGRFEKGNVPPNKGIKGICYEECKATQFKKGNIPHNHLPVGSERINGDDYVDIKIAEPNKWKGKHIIIWEKINGPVPKGHVVIFGDRNNRNFDPDNLILVSRSQLAIMNRRGLIKNSAELTKTGVIIASLYKKIHERISAK